MGMRLTGGFASNFSSDDQSSITSTTTRTIWEAALAKKRSWVLLSIYA